MLSKIYILVVSAEYQGGAGPFLAHLLKNLTCRLQENSGSGISVSKISWHTDHIVELFLKEMILKTDGGHEFMTHFKPLIGYLEIQIETDNNIEYMHLPWLEDVIKSLHEDMDFIGSEFMYLVKDECGALSFQSFSKIHTPNIDTDSEEGLSGLDNQDYAALLDEYLHTGEIDSKHMPSMARLYLVGDAS